MSLLGVPRSIPSLADNGHKLAACNVNLIVAINKVIAGNKISGENHLISPGGFIWG
jgi:hypothetical protein